MSYYDRQGEPITIDQVAALEQADPNYYRVAKDTIHGVEISTVWLRGIDHGFGGSRPLIFETMVFEDGPLDQECWRYATEAAALAGHATAVARVRTALAYRFTEVDR